MDENRKKLYDQLSAQWDMGTFDEFDNDLDNEDNQRVAWEAVGGQDGYGDFDMFRQAIQRSPEQTEQTEQPQVQPQWVAQGAQQEVTDVQDQPNADGVVSDDAATGVTEEKADDADVTDTTETATITPTDVTSTSTDAVETGNVEPVQQADYSSLSLDELKHNMGAMPGHELTQRDIDSRVTYINALADPAARQAEMDKLNLSIAEWDRRAERMREAQRESAIVNKQEQATAVRELNENNQYLADEINATLKKDTTADTSGTSEFSRGMSEPKLFTMFNDTIRKIRSDIKSWTDERLRQELTNRTFDNNADSMERAVLNVAIAKELEARARGEHATTVGEDNFAEYIDALRAIDPQRALVIQQHADAYDKALQGHTSSAQDHGDAALDDNPSYAVPRLAFELLKQRRAALSKNLDTLKRGAPGGTTTAAIEAMGYMQMLRDEDYTECFRQAEQLFGLDKIAGYNAQIMRKFDESMGEAVARYQREAMDTFMEIVTEDMKPSDNWSYIFSYVLNNNFISKSLQAMNGLLGGPVDFPTVYANAMDKYSKENSEGVWNIATQIAAPTATFLVSALTMGQFMLPNIAGRAASAYALRALSGGTEEGLRSLARDGVVKFGLNVLGASANFAAFGVQTALEDQLATGNFDAVKLITAGLEEGLKGSAFGTAGGVVGKIFERSTGWKAYMGEAAKVATEIGAFTGMGYLEAIAEGKDGLTLADIGTNIGIVVGSKGAHFKSWAKDVKTRAKNEGIYGKKVNYHEISDREREKLDELGYHGVGLALKGTSLDEEQAKSIKEELEQMRQDKRVPWELVRCADWVLNGRVEVPPAVAKADIQGNAVDGYTITAVDANGRAIRGGVTVKGNDAKNAMVKIINKEAELARYAEREQNMMSAAAAREQARCAMQFCADSEGRYPDVSAVMNIFSTAMAKRMNKEQLGDVEREVLNGVGSLLAISEPVDVVGERRKLTNEAYNVDLDKAIKKDAAERTDAEKAAIDDYNAWLDRNKDLLSFESDNFKSWVAGIDPPPTKLTHFEASDDIAKAVRERLDKWGEKVDTSNVVIVNSFDEVTDEEARKKIAESERRGSKGYPGWYDKGSGKVFLYLPHIVDGGKDVDVTIMHELVSHKGLRGLMNRPGQFEAFCDEVWKGMSEEDKEKYLKYPADERNIKTEQDRQRLAADEYVARLSERTDPEGLHLWNKLVALLHKVTGIDFKSIGLDARLREEIRKSYREMRKSRKQSEQAQASEAERRTEEESEPIVVGTTEKGEPTEGNGEPVAVEHGTDTTPTESEPTPAPSSETPTADATPAEAEGDGTTGNVNIHSELPVLQARAQTDGRAVDTHDIRELYPNDIDGITEEELPMYLDLMEESRKQAHDYANGLTDQRPQEAMWKYWATRDGLKDPEAPAERHLARPKNKPAQTRRGSLPKTMQNGPRMSEEHQGETEQPAATDIESRDEAPAGETANETEQPAEGTPDTEQPQAQTPTETPAEQVAGAGDAFDAEAERRAAQEADPYYMPMENKGGGRMSPNYRKATAEQIYNHLNDRENETHRGTLDGNIAAGVKRAEDKLKEVRRKEPKGEKRSDEAMDRWEKELAEAQAQADKWHEVERMRQQQKATEGDQSDPTFKEAYDEYTSSDEEPTDLETYVARHLYGTKFKWKDKDYERMGGRTHGLGGHLGLSKSEKERRGFFGWIDENNGSYPESVAESLQANMPDWMRERYDTSEVLDAVLSVVGSNPRPRDMVIDYAKRLREQQRGDDEQYAEREAGERGFSSASDMEAYDNMRERENAGFHDVAAAKRDEASERADRIADARARLNDPNASEFEKQAARTVLRFRFIGEIGAANRDGVDSGERIKNRDIADEMERAGKDARAIKLATGWERGKDGKWRYEEPDLALNDEQFMKFVQHNGTAIYWGKLGELVGDNELFEAYPQLKDLTIYSNTDGDNQYDPKHNEIGLDTNVVWSDTMRRDYNRLAELNESLEDHKARAEKVKDSHPRTSEILLEWAKDDQRAIDEIQEKISWMRKVLNSTLAHEVQHAIQEIEGFAKGGSPRDFGGAPDEMVVGQAIADRMAADRVIEDGDTIGTLREKFNERKGKEDFDTKNERRVIADAIGIMSEGYSPKDVRDLYAKEEKRLWDMYHDYSPESANGKYNRLAGEVESRNVSKRMNMTDEQRRGSLAEDTEDVPRDEQIVRQGYDGVNEMSPVVNATSRIRRGEIDELAKEISSDRSGNANDKLVVKLTKSTQDERDRLKTAISQESNGTYEDLATRAKAIQEMDATVVQPEAVSRKDFDSILDNDGKPVPIEDDGMNVSFSVHAGDKLYNKITSASGIAKDIIHLLKISKYAYSQPHNNTGEARGNGSTHPDRKNTLEYRNYVTKVEIDGDNYYCRFTIMRDVLGDNVSHGAVVSEIKLSKENTTDNNVDGVNQSHELTSAVPNKTRWSSGFTLRDDAKLNTFFELANTGEQKSDDKTLIIPLKGTKTTENSGISQGFGSAATSLNQVASAMRKIDWQPGTVNVDIGGGRFDKATEYLREQGVESMVFDPFNRDAEHNRAVAERVRDERVDTVTCNNVLNVIDSAESRANVILQAAKALKPGGTAYFSVYEGDKSGVGRQTKSDSWQNNRPTRDYISEVERYFDDVTLKNGVIIAKSPKETSEQSVWDFDGSYSGNDVRFRLRDDERRPTFYSNAERAVENVKQGKATAEQWKAMLTKAGGIKAGEDKWMGLTDWLDEHKGQSLTKDEVLQFVRDNGIRMEEVNYAKESATEKAVLEDGRFNLAIHIEDETREGKSLEDALIAWDETYGTDLHDFYKRGLIQVDEDHNVTFVNRPDIHPINSTRLNYTTNGLENKREIAFVLPDVEPYQERDSIHFGPENEGKAVMWVRFGETTDADGNRVLVIDEIQSNRHQDAREKGYKGHGSEYERLKQQAQNTQDAYFEQIEEYARTADGRLDRTKLNRAKEDDPLSKALWEQWGKDERALRQYNESHGFSEISAIPAAPFEKNWHEVAMKRMLRLAADEGFDKVAWTTGEQQAERYDIGNVVESITAKDGFPSNYKNIFIKLKNGDQHEIKVAKNTGEVIGTRTLFTGGWNGKPLSEVLGKDLAKRLLVDGDVDISDDGLRIGGEGMKGFYDEMLPRFMNKYGKKWGAKVGEVELSTPGREVMHSVDVTPEMKESVEQGQPLFRFRDENKTGDHVGVRKTENGKVRVDGLPGEWDDIDRAAHAMQTADPEHMYVPSENGKYLEVHDWRDNEVWDIWRGKPGSKRYENWRKRTLASIHKQVPDYAKKLGLDVELIDNEADVPAGHENEKSWYDPETGKIHIVVPRHAAFDTSDVMSSLWHEGVARHGLRKLVGDENYKSFLENVYNTVDKNIRDEIDRLEEMTDGTYLTATEEYLSRLAEQMGFQYYKDGSVPVRSWMQRGMKTIRENFDKLCRSLGMFDISETLRDDDLRTLLYNSYHRMRAESRNADRAKLIESRNRTYVEEARRRLADPNASEFEKQAARVVINAYGRDNGGGGDTPGGLMFRTRDDADMLVDMVKHNNEIARQRRDAVTDFVKAVTDVDELTDSKFATALGKVMRGQRQYDQDTVKDITDMAKAMVDAGMLSGLDDFAVKQMLTKIKDSTGKNDITAEANKLIDLMLKHQLKKGKSEFEKSLKVKGMKQDSRGVVVQGGLDYHGQRMVKALKEGLSLGDLDAVNQRIDEAEQRLSDPDEVVRGNAKDELDGLYVARQYFDQIKQNEIAEAAVKQQLEQAKQDHKNGTMSDEAYKQFRQACEEALRSLRCERVDAWSRLNETIGDRQGESAERAKQFRDQQKQRKEEIQHWANSDMEGHSADPHENETKEKGFMGKVGDTLHSLEQWFMQPLGTFDMLMRYFGNAHPKGEGYLFGFVRRFMNQRDQWFKQRKADFDKMDKAAMTAAADHGVKIKDWAGIYSFIKKLPKLTITVKGKDYAITQGNAVYLLAMENQADGRMKLRAMGLTEADMERLRGQVNPMLLELSDWVVKELLPGMRPRLNQTHIRMFGADMTDIPNYFPIRTSALARNDTVNLAQQGGKIRPATITGSVIERKRNNTDLDLGADFFQVTAEHIDQMEHWNSFAEYARDLNTLLSYNRFRAQVNNLHSWRYGDGKEIWKTLEDTAAITTGDYQPKTSTADTTVNTAIQGLAAANITFRPFTALKQLLSFPVYFVQARWDDMGYALANLKGTWQWAIDNLPTFAERWQGRMAGDPILTQAEQERGSQNRRLRWLGKAGFAANAAVDAMTVAIGARSIYRTKLRRYKEMGYSEEEANKRALEDAAISVNETQQSGLGAFTSVIQQDRTFFSRMVTLYRNASMGYQRQLAQGLKAMRNGISKEWRDTARAKVQKKLERDGIDSATAAKVADRLVNRESLRGLALAAMFGSIAPFVWSLGAQYLGYKMAGGDDDEQENQMLAQAATHLLSGWAEGIVGGSTVSSAADFIYDYINGRKKLRDYSLQHDLLTDMSEKILGKSSSKPADAVYDIVNMLVAMGTGVNPKSIVEPVVGIIDVVENWGGDAALAHEVALGFCRVLNVPQTSLDKVYVDEIGLTAREAQNLTAEEFAERWCRYKRRRGAGYLSPLTSEESDKETEKKLLQRYERMMDERFESLNDERVEKIMSTTDDKLLKKHAAKAYKSRIDALTDDDVQSYLVPLSDSAPQDSLDTKRDALSRGLKAAGYGSQDKPRSEQGEAYLRQVLMDDIIEDSALVSRAKPYEKVAAEYRKLGGKRDGKQWKRDPQKKGTDRDARKAYKDAHKAELEKAAIVEMKKAKIDELKKKLLDPKADKRAIMDKIRKLRKEAMDALE